MPARRFLPIALAFFSLPVSPTFAVPLEISGTVGVAGEDRARFEISLVSLRNDFADANAATSGDGGRFRLAAPGPGVWRLVAETPGFPPMAYEPLPLVQSVELPPLVLRQPGMRTTFRIQDPSGTPRSGVRVCAERAAEDGVPAEADRGWNVAPQCGPTDEDGRFVFLGTSGQRFDLHARAPGTPEQTRSVIAGCDVTFRLAAPARSRSGVVTPSRPARISGRILDAVSGQPIAGALVWNGEHHDLFTRTDTWGRYDLEVRGSGGLWIQAHAAGYFPRAGQVSQGLVRYGRAPTLALTPAAEVRGRVVDSEGKPLEGVDLAAFCRQRRSFFRTDPADSRSVSGVDGEFHLTRLDANVGTYELRATRPGFVATALPLAGLRPGQVRARLAVTLIRSRRAHGKVLGVDERPIHQAAVRLRPTRQEQAARGVPRLSEPAAEERYTASSDVAGRFQVAELPASRIDITVTREGYVPVTVRGVEVPPGRGPADLGTVILEPGAVVAGVVVDGAGLGLAGAEVLVSDRVAELERLAAASPELVEPDAVTGADGRFALPDLLRGRRVHLLIRRSGYSPASVIGVAPPTSEPLTVVLRSAARVAGRAVDEQERPVAGAFLELRFTTPPTDTGSLTGLGGESALTTSSDDQGRFAFEGVTPGKVKLEAFADGFRLPPVRDLEVPAGEDVEELTIVFREGAVVRGRVLDGDDAAVAGARVHVGGPGVTSDADGAYLLTGVGPGRQTLEAYDQQHGSAVREVEVEPGENTFDLVFESGYEVHGRVVDEEGVGLERVRLRLSSLRGGRAGLRYETFSDARGAFTLSSVLAGPYGVLAAKEGFAPVALEQALTVTAGPMDDLEVVLTKGATLAGAVLGLDPYELAEVRVRVDRDDGWSQSARPSYDGRYEILDLPPGDYRVTASLREGIRDARAWFTLSPGEQEVIRDLEFGGDLVLTGQVLLGAEPLGGVHVLLTGHDVATNRSVITDHQGGFQVGDLNRGHYRLQASDPRRGLLNSLDLELVADREILVELAVASLSGHVVDATSSEPVPEALVVMRHLDSPDPAREGYMRTMGTDAEGFFSMSRVTSGRYRVTARKEGYASAEQILELRGGDRLEHLRLELVRTRGLVLDVSLASGARPTYVTLAVLAPSGRTVLFASRLVNADGLAHFSGVPAGSWELMVTAPGGACVRTAASVPGPPRTLVLPPASRLKVRVPQLSTTASTATLTLTGPDGRPFRGLSPSGDVLQQWRLEGGRATVDSLPADLWTVKVTAQDGQSWSGTVAAAGPEAEVVLE